MARFFWLLTGIAVVLSLVNSPRADEGGFGALFFILWCCWGPILVATIYQVTEKKDVLTQYVIAGAFAGVAGVSFYVLGLASFLGAASGELNEAGLIFIVVPLGFFKFGILGCVLGGAIYYLLKLSNENA